MNRNGFLCFRPSSAQVHRERALVIEFLSSIVRGWVRDVWGFTNDCISLEERIRTQLISVQHYIAEDLFLFFLLLRVLGVGRYIDDTRDLDNPYDTPAWFQQLVEEGIENDAPIQHLFLRYQVFQIDDETDGKKFQWAIQPCDHENTLTRRQFATWLWATQTHSPEEKTTGALLEKPNRFVFHEWWSELVELALFDVWHTKSDDPAWRSTWKDSGTSGEKLYSVQLESMIART